MGSSRSRSWRDRLPTGSVGRAPVSLGASPESVEALRPPDLDARIGDCGYYRDGRRVGGRLSLGEAVDTSRRGDGFVWIGLQQPSPAQVDVVAERFGLPPLAVEDAVLAHQRPKLEAYDTIVFVVLKPVAYIDHEEIVDVSEIALFIGDGFVVSVRHGESDVLRQVRHELDTGGIDLPCTPSTVLYRAADLVVDGYGEVVRFVDEDVDDIEVQVFGPGDRDRSERIYKLKREVAELRRSVVPLAPVLEQLAKGSVKGIDAGLAHSFRDVHDHVLIAADAIEGHDRLLSDVLQANLARVAVRQAQVGVQQNEDMRKISAWAAIALLPTAVAGIYGMNFRHMPELRWRFGYYVVLVLIGLACLFLHRMFRKRGWL